MGGFAESIRRLEGRPREQIGTKGGWWPRKQLRTHLGVSLRSCWSGFGAFHNLYIILNYF